MPINRLRINGARIKQIRRTQRERVVKHVTPATKKHVGATHQDCRITCSVTNGIFIAKSLKSFSNLGKTKSTWTAAATQSTVESRIKTTTSRIRQPGCGAALSTGISMAWLMALIPVTQHRTDIPVRRSVGTDRNVRPTSWLHGLLQKRLSPVESRRQP